MAATPSQVKDPASTVETTIVKKQIEIFDQLSDADYARLCREEIEQEDTINECAEIVQQAKESVSGRLSEAKRAYETIHETIRDGKEKKQVPCEMRFLWKKGIVEHWRTDGKEPVHVESMDRPITDEERKMRLPLSVTVSIKGNPATRSVTCGGKEITVLEAYRVIPFSQKHFSWGDKSPESKQLAVAILLRFLPKDKAAPLVDKFTAGPLSMFPADKELALSLDLDKWIADNTLANDEGKHEPEKASKKKADDQEKN